jgi:hypothetical protein
MTHFTDPQTLKMPPSGADQRQSGSDLRADSFPDNMISNLKNVRNFSFSIGEKAGLRESKNTNQFPNHGIAELSRMVRLNQRPRTSALVRLSRFPSVSVCVHPWLKYFFSKNEAKLCPSLLTIVKKRTQIEPKLKPNEPK